MIKVEFGTGEIRSWLRGWQNFSIHIPAVWGSTTVATVAWYCRQWREEEATSGWYSTLRTHAHTHQLNHTHTPTEPHTLPPAPEYCMAADSEYIYHDYECIFCYGIIFYVLHILSGVQHKSLQHLIIYCLKLSGAGFISRPWFPFFFFPPLSD